MSERGLPARRQAKGLVAAGLVLALVWSSAVFRWVAWDAVGSWVQARATEVALLGVSVLLLGGGLWTYVTRQPRAARPPALSWSVVAVAALVITAVGWGATGWLLAEAAKAKDPSAAKVEAIKTGLGIGAGTGGLFALLLAVRRQWHQELTASDTTFDATERRVTELYTKAVEQLGSGHAAVRLGGLYALGRLAQNTPEQRQTIVYVLCAYLRMPYDLAAPAPAADADQQTRDRHRDLVQEREVRLTAQRILTDHLDPGTDMFWGDSINLDLTGATLLDFDMQHCHVHDARFANAVFHGHAQFGNTTFHGAASFSGATFTGAAWFDSSTTFHGVAQFADAAFHDTVLFANATFNDTAQFARATFKATALFGKATFRAVTVFEGAVFDDIVWFDKATFAGTAFSKAIFRGVARFPEARFAGTALFDHVTFEAAAMFDKAGFGDRTSFDAAVFHDTASFAGATRGLLAFQPAQLRQPETGVS
jgi:uncharacterized protein YjbI with pentapeptide repeats